MNYWVFQGNRDYFNFDLAVEENVLDCWNVKFFLNEYMIGDKVIIWLSGKTGGIAGLATITALNVIPRDTHCFTLKGIEKKAKAKSKKDYYVGIDIHTPLSLFSKPYKLTEEIKALMPVGRVGLQNVNYRDNNLVYNDISTLINSFN